MSTEQQELTFESFLKKRKDKVKLKWVTYWFRLQNTTLFFYTKKHGSALHLRGQYYIYMVQSVREVTKKGGKQFAFEITMKNGKKKLLAAETKDLRQAWVGLLWKAMQLPGPGRSDSSCVWNDVAHLKQMAQSSRHSSSESDGGMGVWDSECLSSTPDQLDTIAPTRVSLTSEEKCTLHPEQDKLQEMAIYDIPPSNEKACQNRRLGHGEMSEGTYDVPTSLLKNISEPNIRTHARREGSADSVTGQL
ncbi:hypothetical protein MATL_G00005820 [Megalops atlanticus]|uniref:PH domain-containing protein n=1 Tax=Megalops atlanticus TaxID=7932 RepID=A0A9D3QF94_MEGAT|nr:hypothetical protein MATL_G00005820 [Megalops atlanticus]